MATEAGAGPNFKIGLFEVGDVGSCVLSCVCCPIALALSRSALDGSEFCFNFFCLPPAAYRFFVRSAYRIGEPADDCCLDCLISCFCFPCNANQLYQTTAAYGNPTNNGGREFNKGKGIDSISETGSGCGACMLAWFCMPIAVGIVNRQAFGMPFPLGCLCMNPMNTRNFLRYQYRLGLLSSDCECAEECVLPYFVYCFGSLLSIPLFCFWPCICSALYGGLVGVVTQEQAVVEKFSQNQASNYLVGYMPAGQGLLGGNGVQVMQPGPAVVQMVAVGVPVDASAPLAPPQYENAK